ncbi:FMN-binding negative transcriptional regulator [Sphingobium sp. CR2-8]|uniref:FMN-binding negative transcriptional regulator n=1 Tax=Sphingobium sp. CR2-8 TaxID=1306534 RepID=UPI002DBA64DB|nr:FMN-binding negative transcriptional regulator [Sphingobium sp. CR2-8]MEC3910134.1 FMN-binding negative transcriptional regulator [Sphingobium sp. CR2-8]
MHPDPQFGWRDQQALRAFVTAQPFGMLFAQTPDGPAVAHVPVVWLDEQRIGFHLSRGNRLASHLDGARALFVVNGPHGYVSPDWYGLDDQVPTWNYVAAELEGDVRALPATALPDLIDALSLASEARLAPKPVWTRDKMTPGLFDRMASAIIGYDMQVVEWRGTRKLGQNKPPVALAAAADGMAAAGDAAIATLMRATLPGAVTE